MIIIIVTITIVIDIIAIVIIVIINSFVMSSTPKHLHVAGATKCSWPYSSIPALRGSLHKRWTQLGSAGNACGILKYVESSREIGATLLWSSQAL